MSDPISDMLTRIRNASRALLPQVNVPHSRLKESVARLLQREGYVADVAVEGKPFKTIKIKLKYSGRKSVIEGLRRVSIARFAPLRGRGWRFRACGPGWARPSFPPRRAS